VKTFLIIFASYLPSFSGSGRIFYVRTEFEREEIQAAGQNPDFHPRGRPERPESAFARCRRTVSRAVPAMVKARYEADPA
jgi:hypothetical protein